MKNHALLAACLLFSVIAHGQYFMYGDNGKPVTIYDIINARPVIDVQQPGNKYNVDKNEMEDGETQYQRILWYWRQHTDADGNLISATKRWDEWMAYKNEHNLKNARTTTNPSNWQFKGPSRPTSDRPGIGRVSALAFHPTDPNTYWVGSAGGGAWKTTNNGASWTAMTDNLPSLIVSDIDINPLNPNTIYLCTGDRDVALFRYRRDLGNDRYNTSGVGVLKSYNGGATWEQTGMEWKTSAELSANCLLINPLDTNCIMLATNSGIYKSMNGGKSWKGKATGDFMQLLYNPADTNIIYASSFTISPTGSNSAQIFRSTDAGETWSLATSFYKVCRVGMAVSPADPNVVKAVTAELDPVTGKQFNMGGVYSSTDKGANFTKIFGSGCSDNLFDLSPINIHACGAESNGEYTAAIAMDPTDANVVYIGGLNAWLSTDGGTNWNAISTWHPELGSRFGLPVVHEDKHVAVFHPLVPGRFFECNDGGIYYLDATAPTTWHNVSSGLGITQFYCNSISEMSTGVVGGAQDNGSMVISDDSIAVQLETGDGMTCVQDPLDSNTMYASKMGDIYRSDSVYTGGAATFHQLSFPGPVTGNWVTPFMLEPSCHTCLVVGYEILVRSVDKGNTWNEYSPQFDNKKISCIGLSLTDPNTVYISYSDTNIVYVCHNSHDTAQVWDTLKAGAGHIWGIETDPRDNKHIWVCYSGYGTNKVAEYKAGTGWKLLNDGLPNVAINCIRLDTATRILYVGTDVGVFYKADSSASWQLFNNGLPIVPVTGLNISYTRKQLWASTNGRGMWMSPKAASIPSGIATTSNLNKARIYPNPNSGDFTFSVDMFYANKRVDMRLVDAMGRTVWSNAGRLDGNAKVLVQTKGLIMGTYIFEAAVDNELLEKKKVILR